VLSIVIPTLNAGRTLGATLASLAEARAAGLACEIIVSDGASTDGTAQIAVAAKARLIVGAKGRGIQLAAGAKAATGQWLMFLHADTCLAAGWPAAVAGFCAAEDTGRAAYFRLVLDDPGAPARRVETLVRWRCAVLALPYGDQGLLLSRRTYDAVGGFRPLPLMEDVDMVRRLGRRHLVALDHAAVTSAERYRRDGWWGRPLRNLSCLSLYFLGVPPARLARLYR
jgi:rSAM/selenodomain-associated transferase 2